MLNSIFKYFNSLIKCLLLIGLFQLLSSCASLDSGRTASSFNSAFDSFYAFIFGYTDPVIERETIDKIPYASALLKIGKGSNGLIILESIKGDEYTWVSSDNIYIVTKDGRIKQTSGLLNNLTSLLNIDQSFKELLTNQESTKKYFSYYSYDKPELINLKVEVSLVNKGTQTMAIMCNIKNYIGRLLYFLYSAWPYRLLYRVINLFTINII